jgi:hypothetical protein
MYHIVNMISLGVFTHADGTKVEVTAVRPAKSNFRTFLQASDDIIMACNVLRPKYAKQFCNQ